MIYRRCFRFLILLCALLGLFSSNVFAENRVHHVVRGDTIFSISRMYQVSQDELMRRNGLSDPSRLQAGMRLVIPSGASAPPAAATSSLHTVRPNETLFSIARSRGVTLQALREINGFPNNYILRAGETIRIPGPPPLGGQAQPVASPAQPAASPPRAAQPAPAARPSSSRTADASIRWPISAREVTYMNSNMGVLIAGVESESIKSLSRGTVVHASPWRGYGNVVIVESAGSHKYLYGVCGTLSVRKGDIVEPGTELGKLGIFPASGKPELVFIVSLNGSPLDPARAPRS